MIAARLHKYHEPLAVEEIRPRVRRGLPRGRGAISSKAGDAAS